MKDNEDSSIKKKNFINEDKVYIIRSEKVYALIRAGDQDESAPICPVDR